MTEEVKEKVSGGKTVVEKRLRPSLIRRRAKKVVAQKPPAEPVQIKDEELGKTLPEQVVGEKKVVSPVEQAQENEIKKPVVLKKELEEKKPSLGVVGHITDVVPSVKEDWKERLKKAPRKKKSKAELDMDTIKRAGGLKHFAELVATEVTSDDSISAPPHQERVFQPTHSSKRRKNIRREFKSTEITTPKPIKKVIRIEDGITPQGLSQAMGIKVNDIIKKLVGLDVMLTANQSIDVETAILLGEEYGFKVEHTAFKEEDILTIPEAHASAENLVLRSPVVTVMGHVDHGKTSILDVIRETKVAAGEAGGITQHIGAYDVELPQGKITFLDTPGHEAFTTMRARGAKATDIVVLVVAADDSIMPQTIEAINHAKAAEVPIIVAINKIDLDSANPDRVLKALTEYELVPEDWGGTTICINTSAKTKEGIDKLLEMILLQAEILELKADSTTRPKGIIIEARLDKSRGPVATVLVQEGTLEIGSYVICGEFSGKIRAMVDASGNICIKAPPSKPVEIVGLSGVPVAGDLLFGVESEKQSKLISELRRQKNREKSLRSEVRFSLDDLQEQARAGELQELCVILKADVQGSVEAIKESLIKIPSEKVKVKIIHSAVGTINESDVLLARASGAIVIGFNVLPDNKAQNASEIEKVEIKTYRVIYDLIEDIKKVMTGLLAPDLNEKIVGRAEVRTVFNISKVGTIAGCMVTKDKILRNARARIVRNQAIIFDGKISSLKRFKDDAKEVSEGNECGISLENFNDIKVGDEIVAYIMEKKEALL